jgi:protein-S-isoprenylcysteine O-methyltransferase Ste14
MYGAMNGRLDWDAAIELPWLIFLAYWILAGFRVNKMERREPTASTAARILVMVPAYYLLFTDDPHLGFLNRRFITEANWTFALGTALTWLGIAFAIWARYHIAQFWSASVALRAGHQLIRSGPYAHIRHPIYTGILTAVLGTALVAGRYRALVAFVAMLGGFIWKSKREERLLASRFGPGFEEHRRKTGFFLPRVS